MHKNIVIIGAVALGPKAACRFKRLEPDSNVMLIDQDEMISYGGCGIPYFVSGDVSEPSQLQSTSFNMIRDENFFRNAKDISVLTGTRAEAIDRELEDASSELISAIENLGERFRLYRSEHRKLHLDQIEEVLENKWATS